MRENRMPGSMGGGWKRAPLGTAPAAYPTGNRGGLGRLRRTLEPVPQPISNESGLLWTREDYRAVTENPRVARSIPPATRV